MSEQEEKQAREGMAQLLERLAAKIRSGETKLTNISQTYPVNRYWANGRWEYFRLEDMSMTLAYFDVAHRKEEQERLEKYLSENPHAECHGPQC